MLRKLLAALVMAVAACSWPGAARADVTESVLNARPSAVRVGVIAVGRFGEISSATGSAFALPGNLLVTNAHVVASAITNTAAVIWIVPPQGRGAAIAKVLRYDVDADLALLRYEGPELTPLSISTSPLQQGVEVYALGYPDIEIVRRDDIFLPLDPGVTVGAISNLRTVELYRRGVETVFHSAGISSGNSGGPLLDGCGRVIGVNTAVRSNSPMSAARGIAVGARELSRFLRQAGVTADIVEERCVSVAEKAELAALARQLEVDTRLASQSSLLESARIRVRELEQRFLWLSAGLGVGATLLLGLVALLFRRVGALSRTVAAGEALRELYENGPREPDPRGPIAVNEGSSTGSDPA